MRNGMLMVRSHFHGQEEEEGCQEGCQEEDDQEEGSWLSLPCRLACRVRPEGEIVTDAHAPGFHSWGPGGLVKRPDSSPRSPSVTTPRGSECDMTGAFTLRRERPARALGRPGRPDF